MNAKGFVGLVLLVVSALVVGGCSHGSGIEAAVYGTRLNSDDLGNGYGGGAKVEINPIDMISVDGRAGVVRFDDSGINMFPLEAAALLNFPLMFEHVVPYVGAGAGYYLFDSSDLDDEVGFFPLAGLEIGFQTLSVMAEARWLFLEADADSAKEELRDLREADLDGFGVNLGVLFRF